MRSRAGLGDVRIHDLRHSYASRALALGESLPVIAKLLGHSRIQTTARYAHLARDSVRAAAARIADGIWEDVLPPGTPGLAGVPGAWDAGAMADDAPRVREGVKAAAARVAADIGADILRSSPGRSSAGARLLRRPLVPHEPALARPIPPSRSLRHAVPGAKLRPR